MIATNIDWSTIGKSVKTKNKLYRQYIQRPISSNKLKYKTYKNKLTCSLRLVKRLYYDKNQRKTKITLSKPGNI